MLIENFEIYEADFDNPSCHGDFLVGISTNEKVCQGKKLASAIVIARPNTHPGEIPYLKAVAESGAIKIQSLAHPESYLKNKDKWMKCLEDNADAFEATTLVTTLNTMMTRQAKANKVKPELKTTTISLKECKLVLANDHFANEEWELNMLPLPYSYEITFGGEMYRFMETMCVWRAYIQGTEEEVQEESQAAGGDDNMSTLEKLMKGTKI